MTDTEKSGLQTVGHMDVSAHQNLLAWDTHRAWGNNIQVFLSPDHALLVFREQVGVNDGDPNGGPAVLTRNVASWVMPLDVAKQLGDAIGGLDFEAVKNAKPDI